MNSTMRNEANTAIKPTQKQISLYKFVRYILSGDSLIGLLYVAYINMLTGLSTGKQSSQHCFLLLQNNGHFYDSHTPKISWMHIFYAFEKYHDIFRLDQTAAAAGGGQGGSNVVQQQQMSSSAAQQQATTTTTNRGITQQELQGLCSVAKLVNQIAKYNEKARMALCEYQRVNNNMMMGSDASLVNSFNTSSFGNNNGGYAKRDYLFAKDLKIFLL